MAVTGDRGAASHVALERGFSQTRVTKGGTVRPPSREEEEERGEEREGREGEGKRKREIWWDG